MNKLKVNVFDCRSGDIVAKDILNEKGLILAAENLMLNDYIISKLKTIGIKAVWLYKEPAREYRFYGKAAEKEKVIANYKEVVLMVKNTLNNLAAGKSPDFKMVRHISKLIYQNIDDMETIVHFLHKIKCYDDYTYFHCVNVGFYSMLIGKRFHMPSSKIVDLIQAGLLHDIGKIQIPSDLLNKKGKLTEEEFKEIKRHPSLGYEILKTSTEISDEIRNAVVMHHERIDGSGYPFGAKGNEIGEYAKIIAIADVYDAMTSDRPYKKRQNPFEAVKMFTSTGLSEFDPSVINKFLLSLSTYLIGAKVQLDTGHVGEIVYIPPHEMVSPIVRVGSSFLSITRSSSPQIISIL